jgi:hypothetical protein
LRKAKRSAGKKAWRKVWRKAGKNIAKPQKYASGKVVGKYFVLTIKNIPMTGEIRDLNNWDVIPKKLDTKTEMNIQTRIFFYGNLKNWTVKSSVLC